MDLDIHQLMLEKLSGLISPENELYLNRQILEDEKVREAWEELQHRVSASDAMQYDLAESWSNISKRKRRLRWMQPMRLIPAAAVVATIIVGGYFINSGKKHSMIQPGVVAGSVVSRGLRLQVAGSKDVIDLSKTGTATTGAALLNNDTANRILSYTDNGTSTGMNKLIVPPGMDYTLKLSDGSTIIVNSATEIAFPFKFSGATRNITVVAGEAYLKVAKNSAQPFVVELPGAVIHVLGTEFNVNIYREDKQQVSLVQGGIAIEAKGQKITLAPGDQAAYAIGGAIKKQSFDMDQLAWIHGKYVLDNTPISELAEVIPRWFNVPVQLDAPDEARKKHFTGVVFKDKPIDDFLNILKSAAGCEYYYKDGILHIR